jgi:hypothetical protein
MCPPQMLQEILRLASPQTLSATTEISISATAENMLIVEKGKMTACVKGGGLFMVSGYVALRYHDGSTYLILLLQQPSCVLKKGSVWRTPPKEVLLKADQAVECVFMAIRISLFDDVKARYPEFERKYQAMMQVRARAG